MRTLIAVAGVMLVAGMVRAEEPSAPQQGSAGASPSHNPQSAIRNPQSPGVLIPIHDSPISDITEQSVKRRLEQAQRDGAKVIVFELNTPGGYVLSAIAVADLIKNLPDDIRTIAWVNTNAHSGGAMVAVACHEIVMAKSSRIGDSEVILGSAIPGVAPQAVPDNLKAKANTPVVNEFLASARRNGYSEVLSRAFVLPELEVWWLENTKTGEREFVFADEKARRLAPPADGAAAGAAEGAGMGDRRPEWKLVDKYYDAVLQRDVDLVQPVEDSHSLLEMSAPTAIAFGFARGIVQDEAQLRERYNLSSLIRLGPNWSETLVDFLTSPWVRGILLVFILLGTYIEFHSPGVGLPGLIALIGLAVFVGAPYLGGLANVWEILLIVVGFALIAVEVFVIPGFGVAGIGGLALLLVGLIATFAPDEPGRSFPLYIPSLPETTAALATGLKVVVGSMLVSLLGMVGLSRVLPDMPGLRKIVPANPTPSDVLVEDAYRGVARVGDLGTSETQLRPAGKARFGSLLVDVVSEGDIIDPGARVEVVERRGMKVVVRQV